MKWLFPSLPRTGYVLASASPRRAQILSMLGLEYEVEPTNVEENVEETGVEPPLRHVETLARRKARYVHRAGRQGIAVGADTIVVVEESILEKPPTDEEAFLMLQRLRDRWHEVHTGIALMDLASCRMVSTVATTRVRCNNWDDAFLRRYVATGECRDKAGGYAIQGLGALLVAEVQGCFYNVMGFPVTQFVELLQSLVFEEVDGARRSSQL